MGRSISRASKTKRKARPKKTKPKPPCAFAICGRESYAKGLCVAHYQMHRRGRPLRAILRYGVKVVAIPNARVNTKEHAALKREARRRGESLYAFIMNYTRALAQSLT